MPRDLAIIFAVLRFSASSRVSIIGKTASPAFAVSKSICQCFALPRASCDAEVMPTIGPPSAAAASLTNAPSASPVAVQAPPMSTSVPARIIGGIASVSLESKDARIGIGFALGVFGVIVEPVDCLSLLPQPAAEAREECMRLMHRRLEMRQARHREPDQDPRACRESQR